MPTFIYNTYILKLGDNKKGVLNVWKNEAIGGLLDGFVVVREIMLMHDINWIKD